MTGGLMNISSYGNENIILHGNPKKTYFKAIYNKHTNFGLQRFRINYEGNRKLNGSTNTILTFKIPRYGDLLYDSYFVIDIPNIWSPFYFKEKEDKSIQLIPYEFKWIEQLGSTIIEEIEIKSGGTTISKYSGEYLSCLVERDFSESKKKLWNEMTGNVEELYDPANTNGNINVYPNAFYNKKTNVEPSIRGRKLYIPLNSLFGDSSKMALPLIALQYQEIYITIKLSPLYNLFTINNIDDVTSSNGLSYRIRPNPNVTHQQLWKFLQEPKSNSVTDEDYFIPKDGIGSFWKPEPHIISTFVFLDENERRYFAQNEHRYLIKQCHQYDFLQLQGSKVVEIESKNLIANFMWRFRRSDVKLRNEWSNYTNWAYNNVKPQPLTLLDNNITNIINPNNFYITNNVDEYPVNIKNIMLDLGIVIGGLYRENIMDEGVYNYIEKYNRTDSNAKSGIYFYNFGINSNRREYQPSGGMNLNKFKNVIFEFNTITPPLKKEGVNVSFICDDNGNAIGFRKMDSSLYEYSFDLRIFEERYNTLIIKSGKLGLLNAK
jgi:hypothetical protein